MSRVSDRARFAAAVAEEAGGLPFLALTLMSGPEVRELLRETRELVGDRPWGVGILGFVPPEVREQQLEVIREYAPPIALIAGGRPSQSAPLEAQGTATYLHVPSPGLLDLFLRDGARRFVFEGSECGGHVGPRTSFVPCGKAQQLARAPRGGRSLRRAQRDVRGWHPRRAVGRDDRRDGRAARRTWRADRRVDGHRVPVHARGGRRRRDRAGLPARCDRLRAHRVARDLARSLHALRRHRLRRRLRRREAPARGRGHRCESDLGNPRADEPRPAADRRQGAASRRRSDRAGRRRHAAARGHVHDRTGRRAATVDVLDRRAPRRCERARHHITRCVRGAGRAGPRGRCPVARRRDRRRRRDVRRCARHRCVLVEHRRRQERRARGAARPLGRRDVLRSRGDTGRGRRPQDAVQVGRLPRRHRVRSARVRHPAEVARGDRAGPAAVARDREARSR